MYKGMRVDAPAAISTCYAWERYQISRAQRWYAADWCRLVMERQPHGNEDSTNAEFHLPDRHRLSTCFVIAAKSLAFDICSLSFYVPQIRLLTTVTFTSALILLKYKKVSDKM